MSAASERARALLADRKLYGAHEVWEGATLGSPGLLTTLAGEVESMEADNARLRRFAESFMLAKCDFPERPCDIAVDGVGCVPCRLRRIAAAAIAERDDE